MNKINYKQGFTLIEMLIVVAIIGLLASVTLIGLGGFQGKGTDAKRISDLKTIQNALELYYTANGFYPTRVRMGGVAIEFSGAPGIKASGANGLGIGVSNTPKDPKAGQFYGYCPEANSTGAAASAKPQHYVLKAILQDETNKALSQDFDNAEVGRLLFPGSNTIPAYCVLANDAQMLNDCSDNNGVAPDTARNYCIGI